MIILNVEQGTIPWVEARLGIPTASRFDEIITNKTMKPSASSDKYAFALLAEQILGEPSNVESTPFMQRGSILEQRAVNYYEVQTDEETERVGFVLRDDRKVGGSPDRFVGKNGILEIKCPSAAVHVGYLLDDQGIGYRAQTQGLLWLAEREWIDTLSFNPGMPAALVRQRRDDIFIKALEIAVNNFLAFMEESKEKLRAKGLFGGEELPSIFSAGGL